MTHAYKAKLNSEERKEFRSLMWEFRRDPRDSTPEDKAKLEALFVKLPQLRKLHQARVRFKDIFDTTICRKKAARALCALHMQVLDDELDLEDFFVSSE